MEKNGQSNEWVEVDRAWPVLGDPDPRQFGGFFTDGLPSRPTPQPDIGVTQSGQIVLLGPTNVPFRKVETSDTIVQLAGDDSDFGQYGSDRHVAKHTIGYLEKDLAGRHAVAGLDYLTWGPPARVLSPRATAKRAALKSRARDLANVYGNPPGIPRYADAQLPPQDDRESLKAYRKIKRLHARIQRLSQ